MKSLFHFVKSPGYYNVFLALKFKEARITEKTILSFFPHIPHNLNLYYSNTNKSWENEDLEEKWELTPSIKFKKETTPDRIPYLYKGKIELKNINSCDNFPYMFTSIKIEDVKFVENQEEIIKSCLNSEEIVMKNMIKMVV